MVHPQAQPHLQPRQSGPTSTSLLIPHRAACHSLSHLHSWTLRYLNSLTWHSDSHPRHCSVISISCASTIFKREVVFHPRKVTLSFLNWWPTMQRRHCGCLFVCTWDSKAHVWLQSAFHHIQSRLWRKLACEPLTQIFTVKKVINCMWI